MAYPQTAPVQPLGVPVRGMNTRDPLANMDPSYAPWILNFEPEPQCLRVRNGIVKHAELPADYYLTALMSYEGKLFASGYKTAGGNSTKIWDVTDGAAVTEVYDYGAVLLSPNNSAAYAGYGAMINTTTGSSVKVLDTTWSLLGFTEGGATVQPRSLTSFKGRIYLVPGKISGASAYGGMNYSATVGGVTGATVGVDLSSLFTGRFAASGVEFLHMVATMQSPANRLDDQLLVIGSTSGEILVYAGDNPAATNWEQVARFKIGKLRGYVPHLEFNNDVWFFTEIGIYSLRELFQNASSRLDLVSPSFLINDQISYLQSEIGALSLGLSCRLIYWPEQNKIYAFSSGYVDHDTGIAYNRGTTFYVYNLLSGAWTVCQDLKVTLGDNIEYHNNNIYMAGPSVVSSRYIYKFSSGYYDEDSAGNDFAIPYALHSAYIPGKKDQNQVIGFEPLMKTDFTGSSVTIKAAADFGRKVSAASSQALLAAGGHQNPFYRVGVDGKFYQYRLEGNSDVNSTTGLELYNMGVAVK